MRSLQNCKLFHNSQQEKTEGKTGSEKTLQKMQEAHIAQRDEVVLRFAGVV